MDKEKQYLWLIACAFAVITEFVYADGLYAENTQLAVEIDRMKIENNRLKVATATDDQCITWLFNTNLIAARKRICKGVKQ